MSISIWVRHRSFKFRSLTFARKFFPKNPAVEHETKEEEEDKATSDETKEPGSLEKSLPAVPKAEPEKTLPDLPKEELPVTTSINTKQEPEAKKLKSTHGDTQDNDDDWEKIDEASVPRHATVEDVDDEEPKKY